MALAHFCLMPNTGKLSRCVAGGITTGRCDYRYGHKQWYRDTCCSGSGLVGRSVDRSVVRAELSI